MFRSRWDAHRVAADRGFPVGKHQSIRWKDIMTPIIYLFFRLINLTLTVTLCHLERPWKPAKEYQDRGLFG